MVKGNKPRTTDQILFKEMLRSIKENIKQFFSVIAIAFLSICLFAGLTSNAYNLQERTDSLYSQSNYADIYVTTSGLDSGDLDAVSKLSGVKVGEKRAELAVTEKEHKSSVNLLITDPAATLSVPVMVDGKAPSADADVFIIADSFAQTYNSGTTIQIGDVLTMVAPNYILNSQPDLVNQLDLIGAVKSGKENILKSSTVDLSFAITGTMMHPEAVKSSRYKFTKTVMYTTYQTVSKALKALMEEYYDTNVINTALAFLGKGTLDSQIDKLAQNLSNQIILSSSDVETSLDQTKDYFSSKGSENNLIIAVKKESLQCYKELQQDIDQALKLTFVFPVIFFLVSLLVILTTISQIIIRERMQIGSLKATGVPKRKIYAHYMSYGFFLTLIGTVLGFFTGPLFLPDVMNIKYRLLWDIPEGTSHFFYPMSITIAVILLVLSLLASFLVAHSVIQEKPVDTLRPKVPKFKKSFSAAIHFSSAALSSESLSFKMAMRNISRNKLKTVMVILGTLGCTALLVCGFGVMDTLDHCIDVDYGNNLVRDIIATPDKADSTLKNKISVLEGVEKCEENVTYPISVAFNDSSIDINLSLIETGSTCFTPTVGVDGGVTLDKPTADKLGCSLGDELTLTINGKNYSGRKVTNIFQSSVLHGIYDFLGSYSEANLEVNSYWVQVKDGADSAKVKEEMKELGNFTSDQSILTKAEYMTMIDNLLSSVRIMTRVVEIFAVLLSAVVIYNLTSLNISERTRDIATMKVLGFRYKEIANTLITEIMLDTLIGTLIGLPLGFPMCVLVMAVNKNEFLTYLYYIFPKTYALAAAISLGAGLVVNLLLTLRTKKIKMVESLKSVD
jgi:putative ABC transport system permease protein